MSNINAYLIKYMAVGSVFRFA